MNNLIRENIKRINVRTYMMVIALVAIWLIFSLFSEGTFLLPRNLTNLFRQSVFTGILAIGMVNVIILGEIDLSVGSIAGLCGGLLAIFNVWMGFNPLLSILLTAAIGLGIGFWNGWWVAYRGVPSFIVTMAGLLIYRGVLIGLTDGITIGPMHDFFKVIGKNFIPKIAGIVIGAVIIVIFLITQYLARAEKKKHGLKVTDIRLDTMKNIILCLLIVAFVLVMNAYHGIPNPVMGLIILFVIFNYIGKNTVFGRRIYAIGGNSKASSLVGIDIKRHTLVIYGINGLMAAAAGIFLTSRLNSAEVAAGTSAELDAIASCVIGGTSLAGGIGTVGGAIIGAVVMASLDNGMSLLDAPFFWQSIVKGLVLLIAVWFDMSMKNRSNS